MEDSPEKIIEGEWVVGQSRRFNRLTIAEGASITAPEGKFVTLTVDGVGLEPLPGTYAGDLRLTVCDEFKRKSVRFGTETVSSFRAGVCVDDGKRVENSSVSAVVRGGKVTDTEAAGVGIESREWDFNGFYITGRSEYTISDAKIALYGDGTDDFVGLGAGIAASGDAKVVVNRADIHTEGITRGTVFVGGNSEVTLNDCELSTVSYVPTPEQLAEGAKTMRMMEPPWMIGLRGNGRTANIAGWGTLNLNRCHATSNAWGVLSVDGATVNRMNVRDCLIELLGENGYGLFSICDDIAFDYKAYGDYGCIDVVDNSVINVPTVAILMSLGNACGTFKNGSIVNSRRFGAHIFRNSGGKLRIEGKSVFNTGEACILVKGANAYIELDDAVLNPANGKILQLMDNDDVGMGDSACYMIPVGETDTYGGRDLTAAVPTEDVFVTLSNMEAVGDFMNSTTDLKANCRPDPNAKSSGLPPLDYGGLRGMGEDLQGAKNLDIRLANAGVRGRITAATAAYREGLTQISADNCEELGTVTQTPAPPVNNGVILTVGAGSTWTVTGDCYLTKLVAEAGSLIAGDGGRSLRMVIDGAETPVAPGIYTGMIEIKLNA